MQPITRFGVCRNGRYWLLWWYDHNGRRHRENLAPYDDLSQRRAAEQGALRVLEIAHGGVPGDRDGPPLSLWLARYRAMRRHELSPGSMKNVNRTCDLLTEHFGNGREIGTIKRSEAAAWRAWLQAPVPLVKGGERHRSPSTVAKLVMWAKHIFLVAQQQDIIAASPFDRLSCAQPKVDQAWVYVSLTDTAKILAACDRPQWRAAFALARYAGLRRNEIESLTWDCIDFQRRLLTVHANVTNRTTKKRRRMCPMSPLLYDVLTEVRRELPLSSTGPWHNMGNNNRTRDARAIVLRAGVQDYAKPLHTLRKSLETDWIDRHGIADVCEWLGNSPAVALAHYKRAKPESFARVSGVETVTNLSHSPPTRLAK